MISRLTRPEPEPPWTFGYALGSIVAMFAALILGSTIAQLLLGDSLATVMVGWSIGAILTIAFVLMTRRRPAADDAALRIAPMERSYLPVVMLFSLGMAIAFDLVGQAISGDFSLTAAELLNFSQIGMGVFGWLIALIFLVGLQPVAEELVFRGVLFPAARSGFGAWTGFIVTAGFHAVFHFAAYLPAPENQTVLLWLGLGLPFLNALVITGVRAYTGSTRAAIVSHAAFGLFVLLKAYVVLG